MVSLNSFDRDVMVVRSDVTTSMVVRFRLELSSGVVGSSPLFVASGTWACSCTMGGWESDTFRRAVRLGMLEMEPSDGGERDGPGAVKLLTWVLVPSDTTVGAAVGST